MTEWISVEDDLPKSDEVKFLVFIKQSDEQFTAYYHKNEWLLELYRDYAADLLSGVTHWMPLPIPPKNKLTVPRSFDAMGEKG